MIINYDRNPNLTVDQKLDSLAESIQMALNALMSDAQHKCSADISSAISDAESSVNAKIDADISSALADMESSTDNKIESIRIGASNIIADSESMMKFLHGTRTSIADNVATMNGSSSVWSASISSTLFDAGLFDGTTPYTLSFEYKSAAACNVLASICGTSSAETVATWTRTKYTDWQPTVLLPSTDNKWRKWTFNTRTIALSQLRSGSGNVVSGYIQFYARTDDVSIQVRHVQLEKGNKVTDWDKSPKDCPTRFARSLASNASITFNMTSVKAVVSVIGEPTAKGIIIVTGYSSSATYVRVCGDTSDIGVTVSGAMVTFTNNSSANATIGVDAYIGNLSLG